MVRRNVGVLALGAALVAGMLAGPASATNESQAAVLGLLYRPGARDDALGGAGVASATGPVASYYNPALLSWQTGRNGEPDPRAFSTTYYKILQNFGLNDMYYMYFPTMFTIRNWGQFSFNLTYLSLGSQTRTDEQGNVLGTFSTYTVVAGLSYSSKIGEHTSAGITAKWFYDHLADVGAGQEKGTPVGTGLAVDAGMVYRWSERLAFGMSLENYGPNVQYIDAKQASPTPVNFNIGMMWKPIDTQYNDITLVGDLYKPLVQAPTKPWYLAPILGWADESIYKIDYVTDPTTGTTTEIIHRNTLREELRQVDVHAGIEYSYAQYVSLRAGWYRDWDGQRDWLTFGAGFHLPIATTTLVVDFAYVHALLTPDPNDGQQVYSVGVMF